MTSLSLRAKLAATVACCLALSHLGGGSAQPLAPEGPALQPYYFASRQGCGRSGCHASPPTRDDDYLCRCDEYLRWSENDRHADATRVLSGPRGRQMAAALGYDVTAADSCLACHGAVIKDPATRDRNYVAENEGVGCVVCHGAYRDWYEPHGSYLQAEKWRRLSAAEKERRYGMTDLWSPARRAALCASCHVGNREGGKFVTHEMYAAGHPPLPGFEVATFCRAMPPHWQLWREKPARVRELLGARGSDYEETRLSLVGAAIVLRERMRLLAAEAAACQNADNDDRRSLDYANFDCAACHHDLKAPSWRQRRGFAGAPGRLPPAAWPFALVETVARWTSGDELPHGLRQRLETALGARPFGHPAEVRPAADDVARWADELAVAASRKMLDDAALAGALALLTRPAAGPGPDYDSARQIGWAVSVLTRERQALRKRGPESPADEALTALDRQLRLTLPAGRKRDTIGDLGEALKTRRDYEPERYRKALAELTGQLGND
jgi:hypothetical protein